LDTQKLDTHDLPICIEVKHDPRSHLLGVDNGILIETKLQGLAFLITF
jgi:hypothetical protein